MEQGREGQVGGQAHGREAVAGDAQPGEGLVVRAPAEHERQHLGLGVLRLQRGDHQLHQVPGEGGLQGDVPVLGCDGHVGTGELGDRGEGGLLLPGDQAHVHGAGGRGRDDVVLVAGGQPRRVGRGAQGAGHPGTGLPERVELRRRVRLVEVHAHDLGHLFEQRARGLGVHERPLVPADAGHGAGQPGDRVVRVRGRAVPGGALRGEVEPGEPLLRGLHEVGARAVHLGGEAAHLGDRLGAPVEHLGVVVHDPACAVDAAGLLVGEERDRQGSPRPAARAGQVQQHREHHGVHALHVHGAAPPDHAVLELGAERVHAPLVRLGGDHVRVPVDDEPRRLRIPARQVPDDGDPARRRLEEAGGHPRLGHEPGAVLRGLRLTDGDVAPAVGGVDPDEVAADLHDAVLGARAGGVHDVLDHGFEPSPNPCYLSRVARSGTDRTGPERGGRRSLSQGSTDEREWRNW